MTIKLATLEDAPLLASLNLQLIRDEGHANRMDLAQLTARMQLWLKGEYKAALFYCRTSWLGPVDEYLVAYALYRPEGQTTYLRQFYVLREHRRKGHGRAAVTLLLSTLGPTRVYLDALVGNWPALHFWRAMGFEAYSITYHGNAASTPENS